MEANKINFEIYLKNLINDKQFENEIPEILEAFSFLQLKKNDLFVKEGSVCKYFCFIESGILQHSITVLGEETTTYIALKNTLTSALNSFKNNVPSRKNIKALSPCNLLVIKREAFHYLLKSNKAFYRFYYNLIENQIFLIDDHRINLLTLTPEERYQNLIQTEPTLLQEVPLHYLASFLGISTRHMSRIRKNIN